MPTFDTPAPILVRLELGVGDVRITATDRSDTVVQVRPTDPAKKSDVAAAEQTRVEFTDGSLIIKAPKGWRRYTSRAGGESIDVEIALPSGSQIRGDAGIAALRCSGPLGECHYNTGVGNIQVDQAGPAHFNTGVGNIAVDRASGHTQINTGSGTVRIGSVDGTAVIKGANGDTWIGDVSRDLRVIAANGSISVDHSHATVVAKTANGDIRLGEVEGGTVVAQTSLGKVDIGIRDGVAAWLDLNTKFGKVYNELDAAVRPAPGDKAVEVRARSAFGDITIRRSVASKSAAGAV
jgi:Putative adhesin